MLLLLNCLDAALHGTFSCSRQKFEGLGRMQVVPDNLCGVPSRLETIVPLSLSTRSEHPNPGSTHPMLLLTLDVAALMVSRSTGEGTEPTTEVLEHSFRTISPNSGMTGLSGLLELSLLVRL